MEITTIPGYPRRDGLQAIPAVHAGGLTGRELQENQRMDGREYLIDQKYSLNNICIAKRS